MAKERSPHEFDLLREKAEKLIAENGEKVSRISHKKDLQKLSRELSVYHIELEMQNDELRRAQGELEESRSRYVELYENAPVGYLTLDEKCVVSDLNLTAAYLLGIDRRFLLKKPFFPLIAPESQDVFYFHRLEVLRSPGTHTCELMLRKNKGKEHFHARLESAAGQSHGGTVIRTVLTDITERAQTERTALESRCRELEKKVREQTDGVEELRRRLDEAEQTIDAIRKGEVDALVVGPGEGESRIYTLEGADHPYRDIVETVNAGAVTIDEQGVILYSNSAFSDMMGFPLQTVIGSPFRDLVTPHDLPLFLDFLARSREVGKTTEEVALEAAKGTIFVRLSGSGQSIYAMHRTSIVITDITERKRTEEALRRQADLLELAHSAIFVRDVESRITFWNRGAENIYGWTKEEALGRSTYTLLNTRFPVSLDDLMATLMRTGKWEGELGHTAKDNRNITVLSRQALQRDEAGNPVAILEINLDITEARRTEEQLRQAQKMEALGTLTGGIGHDFNNILAAMIGFTEMAKERAPKGSRQELHLQRVKDAGLRGRELVKQMLAFSRKNDREKEPLQLSSLVNESTKLLRASIPSTIDTRVKIGSKSGLVLADPTEMEQVLMNLVTNAAHAMREKGGTLDVELSEHNVPLLNESEGMKPGPYLRLVVRDTGVGIPADIMDKIFDPFFTTKARGEGTGLGLSAVHGIVKQLGGYVRVESEPEKGSIFTVYVPKIAEQPKVKTAGEESIPTGRERILFVDDEEALTKMGQEMLTKLGYRVESKTSSRAALAILRLDPSRFDLVITDQTMPEMTGVELAKEVLAIRPDMPIIMCTGFSYVVDANKARAVGIKAFAMKPLTKREIAMTIRRALDG